MLAVAAIWGILAVGQASVGAAKGDDLSEQIQRIAVSGWTVEGAEELTARAFELAEASGSRSGFWSAARLLAELCRCAPPGEARAIRARALRLLAERSSDTQRWSALVTREFLPPFALLPKSAWNRELAAYDEALDRAGASTTRAHVAAEFAYAKAFSRVYINRRWDWLTDGQRARTLGLLDAQVAEFGSLLFPGGRDHQVDTVGVRARSHRYELEHLHFGALAPATSGVDLDGEPIELAAYSGNVIVLDFWTTFCQPCLAMVPMARELIQELGDAPVVYLGVSGDTDRLQARATAARTGMPWRSFWDGPQGPDGPIATAWNVPAMGWPSVIVIDQKGHIRFKLRGREQVEAELARAVQALLREG